ncbi:alpha/beta fold hydrolase [Streptomyces sp. UNOC14_S4]|uniref:alpha/beta fold hydrolase n=1 Tax=Streptomyces sp. UNOC14_S4 TaxID=2872340 RepID=UPI001E303454|nr:alpha/beta fold hydrolase [Streptomyces sp. UNOC14_S4]MCC3769536.1 alpha/beta fold hydrolase [Streptomyces sp. UNOC14_S4]
MRLRLPRRRKRLAAAAAAVAVLAGAGTWTAASAAKSSGPAVHREDRFLSVPEAPGSRDTVRIDMSYFTSGDNKHSTSGDNKHSTSGDNKHSTADSNGRRPAVLLAHGFGGSKDDLRGQAEALARDGYAVVTWSARGFGRSTGRIGLNDPEREVADVSRLIDWLAQRPEVELDRAGDPRVGIAGASYGGAIALLAAGHDKRVDAIVPEITYWNLADALFPNDVFKKLWAGVFFTTGSTGVPAADKPGTTAPSSAACGRFEKALCEMYERVAVAGKPDAAARELLERRSPSAVGDRVKVPTLLVQGQTDSLFPLDQSDAAARAIGRNGAPVSVDWVAGGHDSGGIGENGRVEQRTRAWFDRYLKGDENADIGPAFRVSRTGGIDTTDGKAQVRGASADSYPGLRNEPRTVPLTGRPQSFGSPAGATPPAISTVPGIGSVSQLSGLGVGFSLDFPGQYARFESARLTEGVRVTGSPTVRAKVTSDSGEAVLFAKVYDVGPNGQQVLPAQLVAPVRVSDAKDGRTVELRLPAIDHTFESGHRMRLVLAATDLAYASPARPATYTVALEGDGLSVPTASGVRTASAALPWWTWGLPVGGAAVAAAVLLTGRRRTAVPAPDPALADVPLQITGLSKRYAKSADRYAVRDLSFRVERGQVLGLLGPNGAGKTTTLRMLMGLIRPDGGEVRVFGHAIRPGAPVLSRVGAFVEGAGFLPHLSGRANLDLYWQATGRPAEDAHVDEALEIAGLGSALERAVRTYSQGMRQRLAIAQAMLGLPDLLILDEPTNGLDPPQIREMREVMIRYAAAGRTVIVSSHLLSEVEQSCTHLVVMDRGRLVTAGPVAEIVGSGDTLLVGVAGGVSEAVTEKVAALDGVVSAVRADEGLLVALDGLTPSALLVELVRLEVPVERVGPHRRLEDAFLTLIGGSA